MNKFEKISHEQYFKDFNDERYIEYDDIKMPKRATAYSAGYDFYSPIDFVLSPGESIKFPTGIKVQLDNDKYLQIVPRSSLGFKYRFQLDNTAGIIDADYYGNENNEGHIWMKFTNNGDKVLEIKAGDAVAQGIILQYFKTEDDEADAKRTGGFGSTNN